MKINKFKQSNIELALVIFVDFILASAIFNTHGIIPKVLFLIFMVLSISSLFNSEVLKNIQEDDKNCEIEKELEFF